MNLGLGDFGTMGKCMKDKVRRMIMERKMVNEEGIEGEKEVDEV